jgi:superfamily II DNA/RNA helicase
LPVLERLLYRPKNQHVTRVLIITPTRELATQCVSMLSALGQFTDVRSCLVVGGLSVQAQESDLRTRPDVVVCTPGRMIDLVRNARSIHLEDVEILILDEADRLLQLGFQDELMELVGHTPVSQERGNRAKVVVRCRSLPFVAVRCRSLSFVVVRCRSLSFVVVRCRSLSLSFVVVLKHGSSTLN